MITLQTNDIIALRGCRVQVWRITPRCLHLLGDWSSPAIRRQYPGAVRLHYGLDFLLDGRLAHIYKSAITRAPRIVLSKEPSHVPAPPCPPDLPPAEIPPVDPAGCGDRRD